MGVEAEQLVVEVAAKIDKLEAGMKNARKVANDNMTSVEQRVRQLEKSLDSSTKRTASTIQKNMSGAFEGWRVQQLQLQLNDVFTQLSSGAKVSQVIAQQGAQISQAFGNVGVGGALRMTGAALTNMLSPLNIAMVAFGLLSTAAVEYFSKAGTDTKTLNELLEEHAKFVSNLKNAYGDAVSGIEAYSAKSGPMFALQARVQLVQLQDALAKVKNEFADLTAPKMTGGWLATNELRQTLASMFPGMDEAQARIEALVTSFNQGGIGAREFQSGLNSLAAGMSDLSAAQVRYLSDLAEMAQKEADAAGASDELRNIISQLEGASVAVADALNSGAGAAANFGANAAAATKAAAGLASAIAQINSIGAPPLTDSQRAAQVAAQGIPNVRSFSDAMALANAWLGAAQREAMSKVPIPLPSPLRDLTDPWEGPNASKGGGGRSHAATEAERERKAVEGVLQALDDERAGLAQNDVQRRISTELRRAGKGATDAEKTAIADKVTAIEAERDALERANRAKEEFQNMAGDALKTFISDLRQGKSFAEALADVFDRIADKLINIAVDKLIENAFGGASGGGSQGGGFSFFSWLGKLFGFAEGGFVSGPGSATSDSIPARLSNGEFVVNAAQTKRWLPVLQAINKGEAPALNVPKFANGGLVGSGSVPSLSASSVGAPAITINSPVTVNASGGTHEQNADLAKQVSKSVEANIRQLVTSEMMKQMRPGGLLRQGLNR